MGILRIISKFNGLHRIEARRNTIDCVSYLQTRVLSDCRSRINADDPILPVLIVGAGPVGLVLSILLTKLGVKCAVMEKRKVFSRHPQAHFINNRSMEVFRKLNGLADVILRSQPPVDSWRKFIYFTSLNGRILGSVDHLQPKDFDRTLSPVSVSHFSQYKLTKLLIEQLEDIGFHFVREGSMMPDECKPAVHEILLGHECTAIKAADQCLFVTASVIREGKSVEKEFQCNFLVGADGAGSTVRKLVGLGMNGEKDLQKLVSVHFRSQDLGQFLLDERPGMLFFVFNTEAIGVIVAHDLQQGEFVLQLPFYPPQQKFEDFSSEMCERLIYKLVGRELADVRVLDVKPWVMHAEVADKFLACNNHVILAGDAAHPFPPAGGFGMNTGIQDIHNLAWKLASVHKGITPPSFLSTYETERMQLSNSLLNDNNPLGSSRLSKLRKIFEEGKSLQLQFPSEDLGFRYAKGALMSDNDNLIVAPEPPTGRRRDYVPSTNPGSRLPHMKIKLLSELLSKAVFSTLDLVSIESLEFLLIIAPIQESYNFAKAAFKVTDDLKIPLKVCILWQEKDASENESSEAALLPWTNFIDVIEVSSSQTSESWWDLCQMTKTGAILVRPDEHIAWRAKSRTKNDNFLELKTVFCSVLGLGSSRS